MSQLPLSLNPEFVESRGTLKTKGGKNQSVEVLVFGVGGDSRGLLLEYSWVRIVRYFSWGSIRIL